MVRFVPLYGDLPGLLLCVGELERKLWFTVLVNRCMQHGFFSCNVVGFGRGRKTSACVYTWMCKCVFTQDPFYFYSSKEVE